MNTPAKASLPVIKRLPKYYRYLRSLQADGITSISSRELAAQMGTTASQVRPDRLRPSGQGREPLHHHRRQRLQADRRL